jgi:hypothetical protein
MKERERRRKRITVRISVLYAKSGYERKRKKEKESGYERKRKKKKNIFQTRWDPSFSFFFPQKIFSFLFVPLPCLSLKT